MEQLVPLLFKIENIAILISVLGNIGLGWLHVVWRREEREDRKSAFEAVAALRSAIEVSNRALAETVQDMRNAISAMTGRPI